MLIHSKELFLSGGKKQPTIAQYSMPWGQTVRYIYAITPPKVGEYVLGADPYTYKLSRITGVLGESGSVIVSTPYDSLSSAYHSKIEIQGFVFFRYKANYQGTRYYIVSPKQQVGDIIFCCDEMLNGTETQFMITNVGANTITYNNGYNTTTGTFVSNYTDYIYRA